MEPLTARMSRLVRLADHVKIGRTPIMPRAFSGTAEGPDVILEKKGGQLFELTLNREKKLNALNLSMLSKIHQIYDTQLKKDSVVWLQGAGAKAFCAGGDITAIQEALAGSPRDTSVGESFFFDEYQTDLLVALSNYERNIVTVSVWDKIVMGGGVGIGVHNAIRLVTDKTMFAMPETAIGLFTDVGMTWKLTRLKGGLAVGRWLGMTGSRLNGADCLKFGVGTHFVKQSELDKVRSHLETFSGSVSPESVTAHLEQMSSDVVSGVSTNGELAESVSSEDLQTIEECFGESVSSVSEVLANLKKNGSEFAQKQLKLLQKMSPLSMRVTWEAFRRHQSEEIDLRK